MIGGHWNRSPATTPASLTIVRILSRSAQNRQPDGNHSQGHRGMKMDNPLRRAATVRKRASGQVVRFTAIVARIGFSAS